MTTTTWRWSGVAFFAAAGGGGGGGPLLPSGVHTDVCMDSARERKAMEN